VHGHDDAYQRLIAATPPGGIPQEVELDGVFVRLDTASSLIPVADEGAVSGPTAALGYWNDPDTTETVIRPNPLRTPGTPPAERAVYSGNMVHRDAEGYLRFVSRRGSSLIKTLGCRMGPDEIVDALYASGQIGEVAITTEADERRGDRIVAHIVLAPSGSLDRLCAYARAKLPPYPQPVTYQTLQHLPRLASGTYDIEALRAGTSVSDGTAASPGAHVL
jgi:acyl-CoA synthetase (AMP-forming)/AMP-acid ligase II